MNPRGQIEGGGRLPRPDSTVGYETLLHDVMTGDQSLFTRADMVEQCRRLVQPVLDAWSADSGDVPGYRSGGDGPDGAGDLLARDGRRWRPLAPSPRASA